MTDNNEPKKPFEKHQEIIVAEYNYIAQSAFQAHEDRARVFEFFLISFGTFLAALFSSQLPGTQPEIANTIFSIIFLVVAFLGAMTVLELSRLRHAWVDSARAMNQIKDFVIKENSELEECFRWKTDTIPAAYKPKSVGFLKALQVSVLSGAAIGASSGFYLYSIGCSKAIWPVGILATGITAFLFITLFYYLPLKKISRA